MKRSDVPFNITLFEPSAEKLRGVRQVTTADSFVSGTSNFHPQGLYSTEIFGRVGDERRNYRFAFIDIKIGILHPVVFNALVKMKHLYADILQGTEYAVWNDDKKDFERSNAIEGSTGYEFFIKHWTEINFGETASLTRDQNVRLIKKYGNRALTNKILVLPAGLRELEVDDFGRKTEEEINVVYRRMLAYSNIISVQTVKDQPETLNGVRFQLQRAFNEMYEYFLSLIEGKKKLLLGKFASRRIYNGTRNVITAMDTSVDYLGANGNPTFNSTIVGLYQYLKASLPVSIFMIRQLLDKVIHDTTMPAVLINKDTLQSEEVVLHSKYYSQWATNDGIERVITSFSEESIRDNPLEIDGRYVFLLYKGPDGTFKLMQSIDELPEGRDPAHVKPITFAEFLYIAVYFKANSFPCMVTRYPVTGIGSIYPSWTHLRPNLKFEKRVQLGDDWESMGPEYIAYEFPIRSAYVNSLIPHSAKLVGLGADFDGDTCSFVILYTDESIQEIKNHFNQRRAYVGTGGTFIDDVNIMTVQYVLENMTG